MKVKEIKLRGQTKWVVDGRLNGERKRTYFKSARDAKAFLANEKTNQDSHQWWMDKSPADRVDLINAFEQSRDAGFKLLDAVQHYSVKGRGQTFLKKITVGEAIGTLERVFDESKRPRKEIDVKATGYLKTKVTRGCSHQTLWTSRCTLHNFRDFVGADKQLATITVENIEDWLFSGGINKANWTAVTHENYNNCVKAFFNWAIKRDYVDDNPSAKIELLIKTEYEPGILTVNQCRELMDETLKHDPELLSYASLMLFCGLRPSEAQRIVPSDINLAKRRIILSGSKTKTRQRRIINMSENAAAWFELGTFGQETWNQDKIANVKHRWEEVRDILKEKWGLKKWPHDCMRHSFCSYYLAYHEDAAETALQAGHTEGVLFKHYRALVEKEEAEKFWKLMPPSNTSKNMNLALVAGLLAGFNGKQAAA